MCSPPPSLDPRWPP
ncbi:hypothetical protein CRUP_001695 [Coryphaenoides rupestris]|nr:hypothetical protein CRUP_001695 [Coryphaenoides rupestris]